MADTIDLKPTSLGYRWGIAGGYEFTIETKWVDEHGEIGWRAEVVFKTRGFTSPETAVIGLRHTVVEFLGQLERMKPASLLDKLPPCPEDDDDE